MTLNQILNEIDVEFGNGQTLAVTDTLKSAKAQDKTGALDTSQKKTRDISLMSQETQRITNNISNYLKSKGVFDKVATKQSFNTTDVVMKADGSCTINYDDGGGITIPKDIVLNGLQQPQKIIADGSSNISKWLKDAWRKNMQSSCKTEEIKENYFNY